MASVATQQQISFANGVVIALGKLPSVVCHFGRTSISSYYDGSGRDIYALKQFSTRNGHEQVHVNEREKKKIGKAAVPAPRCSLIATDHDLKMPYFHETAAEL